MDRHAWVGKKGFFPDKAGMASILSCHAGYFFQLFQIIFASTATRKVFLQNPSLPASHKVIIVENQGGFKSSAGIHSALLSSFPFFRLAAGLLRSAGRKSTPPLEDGTRARKFQKTGARGRIQERLESIIRKEEKPVTFSPRRNDTPSHRKSRETKRKT